MNKRLLGNILVTTFLILSISGTLMFFTPFKKNIASVHTFFSFLFLIGAIFHIINNKLLLSKYLSGKKLKIIQRFQAPIVVLILLFFSLGLYMEIPVLNEVYNWGNQIRSRQIGKEEESFNYQIVELNKTIGSKKINVELKKGESFQYPLFAAWIEDSLGNYIETIYISKVISSSRYEFGKKIGDRWEPAIIRRPASLPYWAHKRGIKASDGYYIPLHNSPDLDAVSGATPTNNFVIKSKGNMSEGRYYKILFEVNQSFDWNEYYTKDKFPDDEIYSGSGLPGQPSLIYAADINLNDKKTKSHIIMKLIGHSHHSGKNGKLYTDLTNITTAKNIADRIIITVEENPLY